MHRRKPVQTEYRDRTPTHEERLKKNHEENREVLADLERQLEVAKAYIQQRDTTVAEIEVKFDLPPGGVDRVLESLGLKIDRPEE